MKISKLKFKNPSVLLSILFCVSSILSVNAQSTRQDFPTPVTTNEISGKLPARDIGDARLTNYFYAFNGSQGDIFINVQTTNLNGDIDIFTADNLKSLTKITIYADVSSNETGRVIYLRKPEKLILRIQGRSPNDDDATFRIKFAGSFEPLQAVVESSEPELPQVKSDNQSDVRVNSVGTIIEVKPKPTRLPKETTAEIETKPKGGKTKTIAESKAKPADENSIKEGTAKVDETATKITIAVDRSSEENTNKTEAETVTPTDVPTEKSTKIVITDEQTAKNPAAEELKKENEPAISETSEAKSTAEPDPKVKITGKKRAGKIGKSAAQKPSVPNPLENIKLIVLLKDGTKIEHQMSEVLRFKITNGILTIITKDGKIERHSIVDIEKTIIE